MGCPYCGSDNWGRAEGRLIENWSSDEYVRWYHPCVCDDCGRKFWEKTEYVCTQEVVTLSNDQFEAIREDSKKEPFPSWSE